MEATARTGRIYLIFGPTEKCYVGKTIGTVKARFERHIRDSKNPKRPSYPSYFARALRFYGADKFDYMCLGEYPEDQLNLQEQFWISFLETLAPRGYNLQPGGTHTMTPEIAAKISKTLTGVPLSAERKEKCRIAGLRGDFYKGVIKGMQARWRPIIMWHEESGQGLQFAGIQPAANYFDKHRETIYEALTIPGRVTKDGWRAKYV